MGKKKVYAVALGRKPGIYETWSECKAQTDGFKGAKFKSFASRGEAETFISSITPGKGTKALDQKRKKEEEVAKGKVEGKVEEKGSKRQKMVSKVKETSEEIKAKEFTTNWCIHFDGGSRGNPGRGGSGALVVLETANQTATTRIAHDFGTRAVTNNVAEYTGLRIALDHVLKNKLNDTIGKSVLVYVRGDSDLVIQQMNGTYKCKHPKLVPIYNKCREIVSEIRRLHSSSGIEVDFIFEHVLRNQNSFADELANWAMDNQRGKVETDIKLKTKSEVIDV